MGKLSKTLAISACLLFLSTAAILWAVSTGASVAGDKTTSFAYSLHGSDNGVFLGVVVEEETEHSEGGARIESVVDDSAADEAGLEEGDVIVGIDGHTIRGPKALTRQLEEREPGDAVEIDVIRDGRELSFDVELGKRTGLAFHSLGETLDLALPHVEMLDCEDEDDCEDWNINLGSVFRGRRPLLGVQLVHVTDELREHLGGEEDRGVLVSKIVSGSPAEEAGIAVGDLVVGVDGEPIEDADDIRKALADKVGESFDVDVIRDRRTLNIEVTIPEREVAPTGPRAYNLRDLRHLIDSEVKGALVNARDGYRGALRAARVERSAMLEAREPYREAMRQFRESRRETTRQIRDAVRRQTHLLNSI